jgi:L-ascorbate metabolism protein UlaG (beta-lactamase superfamily)
MKKSAVWIGLVLTATLGAVPSRGEASKAPLILQPLANAGALVACGGKAVLIDALFDKPNPEYRAPANDVLEKMRLGEPPFDGVDLVLVTHNHPDHFDPALAVRYLEARPEATLVIPADAVAAMQTQSANWEKVAPRIVALDLKLGQKATMTIQGIPLTAFRTLHGRNETPMNLMYLFEVGGRLVFHEGDSNASPKEWWCFGLGGAPIDLALVHYWMPLVPDQAGFLREVLAPAHIALTHLPVRYETGEWPVRVEQVKAHYADIFLMKPAQPAKVLD